MHFWKIKGRFLRCSSVRTVTSSTTNHKTDSVYKPIVEGLKLYSSEKPLQKGGTIMEEEQAEKEEETEKEIKKRKEYNGIPG